MTYRVHFEVPGLARGVEVDDDFFVLQAQLLEGDVGAVSPGADVVCVEDDLGGHIRCRWWMTAREGLTERQEAIYEDIMISNRSCQFRQR